MWAFSDGIFAVLLTVLVLNLIPPRGVTVGALLALQPTGVSCALSYLFIATMWVNHHQLRRFAMQLISGTDKHKL